MSMINYPLTIDTCRQNAFKTVLAQQFDSHSRTMVITLQEDNEQFIADSSMTAVLYVTDEEHTEYPPLACSINEDGTVSVPISSLILTQRSGLYDCSLVLFNRDSERLGTFPFSLDVVAGSTVPVDTFSDESVELLTTLIGRTTGAIEDTIQATAAANSAAERAEQAAEQLDVDLTEIHQEIDDTNTRIDELSAADIEYGNDTVETALDDLDTDVSNLKGRMTTAEGDISSLYNDAEMKANKVSTVSQASDEDHYPSAKAVYDAVKVKADTSSLIPIINTLNTKEDKGNKVQEITDEQGTSNYPSVPAVIDYVDEELSYVQMKSERVRVVDEDSTNYTYPTSKAVYDAIQAGGGASAMMVTFTITGIDSEGNYTGVADKTYTEMSDALTNGEVVRGQISVNGQNFISYSTALGSSTIRFYLASRETIIELVAEWAGDGDNEGNAQFTVYASVVISPSQMESAISTAISGTLDKGIVTEYTFPIPYGTPDTTAYNTQYPERGFLVNYNDYSTTGNVNITFHTATSGGTPQVYRCTRLVIPVQEGDTFVYTGMAGGQRTIPNYVFVGDAIGESADWYENISAGQVISFPLVSASSSSSSGSQIAYKQRTLSASSGFEYDGSTMLREFTKTETIGTKVPTALPMVDGNTLFIRASSSSFGTVGINHGVIVAPAGAKFLIVQGAFNRMYDSASVSGFYDAPVEMQPQIVQINSGSKPAILNTTPDYYTWRGGADYFNALSNFNPFYKYEILS